MVPGHLANPVWVDDADFDITYHVRRSALPRPGSEPSCATGRRLMSRPLDRNRPLWEMYLVEGLDGGRIAVISKTHHALVDGLSAVDIGQVILDVTPTPREVPDDLLDAGAAARRRSVWSADAVNESGAAADRGRGHGPDGRAGRADDRGQAGRRGGRARRGGPHRGPARAVDPDERADRRAAPVRRRPDRPRRLQARSARRTAARSTTSCWPRSPARCAAGCCPAGRR